MKSIFGKAVATLTLAAAAVFASPAVAGASGEHALTAGGAESIASETVVFSVAVAGGVDDNGALPSTGGEGSPAANGFIGDQLLSIWVSGGLLVLAGASVAVAHSVRRSRQTV